MDPSEKPQYLKMAASIIIGDVYCSSSLDTPVETVAARAVNLAEAIWNEVERRKEPAQ